MPEPLRKYSQNWLANDDLAIALVNAIDPQPGDRFIEVGPGEGRLTRALLQHPVQVTAVEIDPRCRAVLGQLADEMSEGATLEVVEANVLDIDLGPDVGGAPLRFVGNLPYAIASPILRWTVKHHWSVQDVHYMLPADVATRILAPPGSSGRGLISVIVGWFFNGEIVRKLGPGAFRPSPKIDSAFVRLTPRQPPACAVPPQHRRSVVEAAFAHRRKTLRNGLRQAGWKDDEIDAACAAADVVPGDRAEALSVEAFARLAEALPLKPA